MHQLTQVVAGMGLAIVCVLVIISVVLHEIRDELRKMNGKG